MIASSQEAPFDAALQDAAVRTLADLVDSSALEAFDAYSPVFGIWESGLPQTAEIDEERGTFIVEGAHVGDLGALDAVIMNYMLFFKIPHTVVMVVSGDGDGRLVYAKGFTWLEKMLQLELAVVVAVGAAPKLLITEPETRWRIASLTKHMTATAIHQAARPTASGGTGLQLNDSMVARTTGSPNMPKVYRKEIEVPFDQYQVDGAGVVRDLRNVTVRDLVEHTAGWQERNGDPYLLRYGEAYEPYSRAPRDLRDSDRQDELPLSRLDMIRIGFGPTGFASYNSIWQWRLPGQKAQYSSFGYLLLGRVLEHEWGQVWSQGMRSHLWSDAHFGMHHTDLLDMAIERCPGDEVRYYNFAVDDKGVSSIDSGDDRLLLPYGGFADWGIGDASGGVRSTGVDMARWARNLRARHPPRAGWRHPLHLMWTDDLVSNMWTAGHSLSRNADGQMEFHGRMNGLATSLLYFPDPNNAAVFCACNRTRPAAPIVAEGPWLFAERPPDVSHEADPSQGDGVGPQLVHVVRDALNTLTTTGASWGTSRDDLFPFFE